MKAKPQEITNYHTGYGNMKLDIQSELNRIHNEPGYIERKKILDAKSSEGGKAIFDEIAQLQERKSKLQSFTLQEIVQISKVQAEKVFNTS